MLTILSGGAEVLVIIFLWQGMIFLINACQTLLGFCHFTKSYNLTKANVALTIKQQLDLAPYSYKMQVFIAILSAICFN